MNINQFHTDKKILIVAEIGNNHEGNFDVAKKLIAEAATSGVDAVKFQTFKTEKFIRREDQARFERLKSFELTYDQFSELAREARRQNLLFLSTPLDLESADFLNGIVDAFKIASGDFNFYPLIDQIVKTGKPVILSTGLCDMDEIIKTLQFIGNRSKNLGLLHCVSNYPVPPDQINLRSIPFLRERFPKVTIGYSDHVVGIGASVASAALGARIIEKHFTLDHHYSDFRDHQLSADPDEMRELVRQVRQVERMLGNYDKQIQPCEASSRSLFRRGIVACRPLSKGHQLTWEDLLWVRPAQGISPGEESKLIGRKLCRDIRNGDFILEEDLN